MITVNINIEEAIREIIPDTEQMDNIVRIVATTMRGEMSDRIHNEGLAADGGDIGVYSREPLYVSISQNPGQSFGRPIGKTGKSKFETGKKAGQDHKSRYFPGGYDEFKTKIGRNQLGKVNLSLSGELNRQMSTFPTDQGWGIGWQDEEKFKRAKGLEKKYRPIWNLTDKETEKLKQVATDAFFERAG